MSVRGVRMVAMTCQSRSRKWRAISRPKPDEQPVIRIVFMLLPGLMNGKASIDGSIHTIYHVSPCFVCESPALIDPLAEVVTLLQPNLLFSKALVGAGSWRIAPPDTGQPFYSVVLEGEYDLSVAGHESIHVEAGDFVLVPVAHRFEVSSREPPAEGDESPFVALGDGEFRVGAQSGATDLRMLIGHCNFASPDADLLVPLLPHVVHVRCAHAWRSW